MVASGIRERREHFFFFVLPENRGEIRVFIEEQAHITQSLSMHAVTLSLP